MGMGHLGSRPGASLRDDPLSRPWDYHHTKNPQAKEEADIG